MPCSRGATAQEELLQGAAPQTRCAAVPQPRAALAYHSACHNGRRTVRAATRSAPQAFGGSCGQAALSAVVRMANGTAAEADALAAALVTANVWMPHSCLRVRAQRSAAQACGPA
jgi:hypothetical protein